MRTKRWNLSTKERLGEIQEELGLIKIDLVRIDRRIQRYKDE